MPNQLFLSNYTLNDPNWLGIACGNGGFLSAEQIRLMLEAGMSQADIHLLIQQIASNQNR